MAKRECAEDTKCSVAQCDIFDFMANHVGLTVIQALSLNHIRCLVLNG